MTLGTFLKIILFAVVAGVGYAIGEKLVGRYWPKDAT